MVVLRKAKGKRDNPIILTVDKYICISIFRDLNLLGQQTPTRPFNFGVRQP